MICLVDVPRILPVLAILALCACTDDGGADDGDGTDEGLDEPQACIEPGSPLIDEAKPVGLPGPSAMFTCTSGWATDAPQLDPTWTIELEGIESEFGFGNVQVEAHPDGGVVVIAAGLFARYDADGEQLWSVPGVVPVEGGQAILHVEPSGEIIVASFDWNVESSTVERFDADGGLIGPVAIPWNAEFGEVWALVSYGDDLLVGAFDQDAQGSFETTFMHLDPDDNLILRKSTNMTNSGLLAVSDDGTVVFGRFPTFLLDIENGAVLGNLTPSLGNVNAVVGDGSGFVTAGASGDFMVGRYTALGSETWLQAYDRATLNDFGRAIAVGEDGTVVAVGSTALLDSFDVWFFSTQPWVVGVDADGNALWADRIAALGDASGVAIGSGGEVYVGGSAEGQTAKRGDQPPLVAWLRRYDP